MSRILLTPKARVKEISAKNPKPAFRGYLAEDYDGIGQYILVALSKSSTSSAYKAKIAAGDFGTAQVIPSGTPVVLFSNHGLLEILSMGVK